MENINDTFKIKQITYNLDADLIYYNFFETDYFLGEPCLNDTVLNLYTNPRINVYEHLKTYNEFKK